ncbi:MAG: tyrosine-type recombinase/integrase, partial [Polynucleobacter sp.]
RLLCRCDGQWAQEFPFRYRFEKKLRVVTLGDARFTSCDEARQMVIQILKNAKHGLDPQVQKGSEIGPLLGTFFQQIYLPYVKSYKRSWATDDSMIRNHLLPKLGHLLMSSISPPDVAVFLEKMKAERYASGTCNRALVLLRFGFTLALRWKVKGVEHNPVKEIKNIKDDNKIERYLTQQQTIDLLTAVRQSDSEILQYIVLFLIYTGARKREVLDSRWRDIDWAQRSWRIPKTKSGKVRHVPLSTGAMKVLEHLRLSIRNGYLDEQAIFSNPKTGKPFVSFFYSWNNARIRAGLPEFRIHDLRHSFASYLVNAGRSLYEVQELLGHADIKTTSRYAHLSRERLVAAVETVPQIEIGESLKKRAKDNPQPLLIKTLKNASGPIDNVNDHGVTVTTTATDLLSSLPSLATKVTT